jgi:carbon-monoxide dehydrogenase small subunit
VTVNCKTVTRSVEPRKLLIHFLREDLGLTGGHVGCDSASCGCCTVILNGEPVKSCIALAVQADGGEVLTVEGLAPAPGELHILQQAFWESDAAECGFCTPGMLMASYALLNEHPAADDADIREGISGNLCRCTGYRNIIKAIKRAQELALPGDILTEDVSGSVR